MKYYWRFKALKVTKNFVYPSSFVNTSPKTTTTASSWHTTRSKLSLWILPQLTNIWNCWFSFGNHANEMTTFCCTVDTKNVKKSSFEIWCKKRQHAMGSSNYNKHNHVELVNTSRNRQTSVLLSWLIHLMTCRLTINRLQKIRRSDVKNKKSCKK